MDTPPQHHRERPGRDGRPGANDEERANPARVSAGQSAKQARTLRNKRPAKKRTRSMPSFLSPRGRHAAHGGPRIDWLPCQHHGLSLRTGGARRQSAAGSPSRLYFAYSTILDRAAFDEWRGQHGYALRATAGAGRRGGGPGPGLRLPLALVGRPGCRGWSIARVLRSGDCCSRSRCRLAHHSSTRRGRSRDVRRTGGARASGRAWSRSRQRSPQSFAGAARRRDQHAIRGGAGARRPVGGSAGGVRRACAQWGGYAALKASRRQISKG